MINHGIKRLKLAASGEDFFQVIPDELPQEVKDKVEFHFVKNCETVLAIALEGDEK